MKIYDITQELFSGKVYPGDPVPFFERLSDMEEGARYNLTAIHMCAHNGTHVDAPFHFYKEGKTMEQIDLSRCIGPCRVIDCSKHGLLELAQILKDCHKKLLLKGDLPISLELAKLFNQYQIELIGVESQSVGDALAPAPVHLELLGKEVVLLEGIVLDKVQEGEYFLFAAPLKAGGSDGAPCRAVLIDPEGDGSCNPSCIISYD